MNYLMELEALGYVAMAMFLGAVVGFERELASKPAGMRTHMLVAGAAALLVLLSDAVVHEFDNGVSHALIQSDPVRIIEAIVAGVAFLGAGTIIRHGSRSAVQGLTTAATLLFTAALGVCVAVKELLLAGGATLLVLATLRMVHVIEEKLKQKICEEPSKDGCAPGRGEL
jgi:putative Mg2+ transporter-C (MgtC) family protein